MRVNSPPGTSRTSAKRPGGVLVEVHEGLALLVEGAARSRSVSSGQSSELRQHRARGCRVRRRADVARQQFIIPVRSPPLDIRDQMQADLREAMKARDSVAGRGAAGDARAR